MSSTMGCDCGTTLAEALGACGCPHCGGRGCPHCSFELEAATICLWCGQLSVMPQQGEAPWFRRPSLA